MPGIRRVNPFSVNFASDSDSNLLRGVKDGHGDDDDDMRQY